MQSVTVSTPQTVMENVIAKRQKVVMQRRVVNRTVVVKVSWLAVWGGLRGAGRGEGGRERRRGEEG